MSRGIIKKHNGHPPPSGPIDILGFTLTLSIQFEPEFSDLEGRTQLRGYILEKFRELEKYIGIMDGANKNWSFKVDEVIIPEGNHFQKGLPRGGSSSV